MLVDGLMHQRAKRLDMVRGHVPLGVGVLHRGEEVLHVFEDVPREQDSVSSIRNAPDAERGVVNVRHTEAVPPGAGHGARAELGQDPVRKLAHGSGGGVLEVPHRAHRSAKVSSDWRLERRIERIGDVCELRGRQGALAFVMRAPPQLCVSTGAIRIGLDSADDGATFAGCGTRSGFGRTPRAPVAVWPPPGACSVGSAAAGASPGVRGESTGAATGTRPSGGRSGASVPRVWPCVSAPLVATADCVGPRAIGWRAEDASGACGPT